MKNYTLLLASVLMLLLQQVQAQIDTKYATRLAEIQSLYPPGSEPLFDGTDVSSFTLIGTSENNGIITYPELTDSSLPYSYAVDVDVIQRGSDGAWKPEVKFGPNTVPISEGDVVAFIFDIKSLGSEMQDGVGRVNIIIQDALDTYPFKNSYFSWVGFGWKRMYIYVEADRDYPAGELQSVLWLGELQQHLQFAGIVGLNLGPDVDIESLPSSQGIFYTGMEEDATWRTEAVTRIDNIRKRDLEITVNDLGGNPVPAGTPVHVKMKKHEFKFGTFADRKTILSASEDANRYRSELLNNFNSATTGFFQGSKGWGWHQGQEWRDSYLNTSQWLNDQGLTLKGTPLVWPGWRWMPPEYETTLADDPPALRQAIQDHLDDMVPQGNATGVEQWEVINEPYGNDAVMQILGDEVMIDWFNQARSLAPDAVLNINETNVITSGGLHPAVENYKSEIQFLLDNGAPVDAIGIQGHFVQDNLTGIRRVWEILDEFGQFGLPVQITEFDASILDDEAHIMYVRDFMTAMYSHEAVDKFTMWGFWEPTHWRGDIGAGMVREDWSYRPAMDEYVNLVFNEWWTDEVLYTDASGKINMRGFKGDYDIIVGEGTDFVTQSYLKLDEDKSVTVTMNQPITEASILVATQAPVIDGTLNDDVWDLGEVITPNILGSSDNEIRFDVLWDKDNLYVGVNVKDGNIHSGKYPEGSGIWASRSDAVIVFIDGNNSKIEGYDGTDDFAYILQFNGTVAVANGNSVNNLTGVSAASALTDDGYAMEFSIPWSTIGLDPSAASVIGFDISVNDNDNGGNTRNGQSTWIGTWENVNKASLWGNATLLQNEKFNQTVTLSPIADRLIQDALSITLSATSSAGLPLKYKVLSGPATVFNETDNLLELAGSPGEVKVVAFHEENEMYNYAGDTVVFEVTANTERSVADRTLSVPTIDGAFTEPEWIIAEGIEKVNFGNVDNNMSFDLLWDEEYLYFAIEVKDDFVANGDSAFLANDVVILYIDGDNSKFTAYDGRDDLPYPVEAGISEILGTSDKTGVQVASVVTDVGYNIEMALPWTTLKVVPQNDIVIGLDITINDNDALDGTRDGQAVWSGDGNNYQNTSKWGQVTLLGKTQTLTFDAIDDKLITDADFEVNATSDVDLPITSYSIVSGPASIVTGNMVALTGSPGVVEVRAFQEGNDIYAPAEEIRVFEVIAQTERDSARVAINTLTIDGVLSEADWELDGVIEQTTSGTVNNTMNYDIMWDENNLYLAVNVEDAVLHGGGGIWNSRSDGILVFVDGDNSKFPSYDGINDLAFFLLYNNTFTVTSGSSVSDLSSIIHATSVTDSGYSIEIAIPWTTIGVTPAADKVIGLDFYVNDNDNGGNVRDGQASWSGSFDNNTNTSKWGQVSLKRSIQEISIDPVADKLGTDADFGISVSSNSGLPITTYSVVSGPATLVGESTIDLIGSPGTVKVAAYQEGSLTYLPASDTIEFNVSIVTEEDIAPLVSSTPTIDGVLAEADWNMDGIIAKTTNGTTNNTIRYDVLWNGDSLYLAVNVEDALLYAGGDIWHSRSDGIIIFLDGDNSKQISYDGINDLAFFILYDGTFTIANGNSIQNIEGVNYAIGTTASGYAIEVAIPWTTIGIEPLADKVIGLDFYVNDNDSGVNERDGQSSWSGSYDNNNNTVKWGQVMLEHPTCGTDGSYAGADEIADGKDNNCNGLVDEGIEFIEGLNLTSMCSDDPSVERRWRVRNPNVFGVAYTWEVYGTNLSGSGIADSGDTFFFTPTVGGANTTIIKWQNIEGEWKSKIKASGGVACSSNARLAASEISGEGNDFQVYPNPTSNLLKVRVDIQEKEDRVVLKIMDLTGKEALSTERTLSEGMQEAQLSLKGLEMSNGIYLLQVQTREKLYQTRFIKQ